MAIANMKLVKIEGPIANFDIISQNCIINRNFHPENAMEMMHHSKVLHHMEGTNPYLVSLSKIQSLADRLGIKLDFRDFKTAETPYSVTYFEDLYDKLEKLDSSKSLLTKSMEENKQILKQLDHINNVNAELHDFFEVEYCRFRFGRIPREIYDSFSDYIEKQQGFFFIPTSIEHEFVYGMYLALRKNVNKTDAFFASMRFERIYIPDKVHGTSDVASEFITGEIANAKEELVILEAELAQIKNNETETFLSNYSHLRYLSDTFELRKYSATTGDTFFLFGWVPEEHAPDFIANLKNYPSVTFVSDFSDSMTEASPPVKLKNHWFFRPFEPFVEMYGRPSYNEVDPTPLMTIIYTLLFGIMYGDVGQGLLLSLFGFLMWRIGRNWLGKVLIYAGIAGTGFGFVYGSVFGFEHLLPFGFKVLESSSNTDLILRLTVYVGIAIIVLVMSANIFNGFKQKDYEKALFSPNGIAGVVFYLSIMVLVLPMLGFLEAQSTSGAFMVFGIALPLMLIIFRNPLGKLVSGRKDWLPESFVDFLLENVFELIELLLSYISNTISFMRVGIFALSHAGMMMVVFLLAGESENIVVIAIGNLVVMGIEGLLVGIQVLRLNFYEMFGRFFSAEGRAYEPIVIDYKSQILN